MAGAKKPFFYKIVAAELMSEVLQIPDGKHREWLTQFVIDLVSANGTTEFTKKLISETEEFRKKKSESGAAGGKKSRRKKVSNAQAKVSSALPVLNQCLSNAQAKVSDTQPSNRSSNKLLPYQDTELTISGRLMVTENGSMVDVDTGEEFPPPLDDEDNPFGRMQH